jgi:hypothetical protein
MDLGPPVRKRLGNALLHLCNFLKRGAGSIHYRKTREYNGMYRIPSAPYGTPYTFILSGNTKYILYCAVHEAHMLTNLVAG